MVVLVGRGPHSPYAARRAVEFVRIAPSETSLTLLNVQVPGDEAGDSDADLQARGPEESPRSIREALVERLQTGD
ncbi:MAG: hypothetical protein ACI91T_002573 [Natronomonas sp.]|jgi:hypothetical protein